MKRRLSAAMLAASMLTTAAYGADWVYVSSWAYNDVSNFTNEGLLPDTFADVSDYRAPATLEQICELLMSVADALELNPPTGGDGFGTETYEILSHQSALYLGEKIYIEIPEGILKRSDEEFQYLSANYSDMRYRSSDWYGHYYIDVDPYAPVTRGEAAILFNDCYAAWIPYANTVAEPTGESYPNTENAPHDGAVYWCHQNGIMDAGYDTLGYMTIEQAIVAAYRVYLSYPATLRPDGVGVNGYIQTYSNGIEEHRAGNSYILKQNGQDIASFECDVYKNIYCTTLTDGRTVAAAEHVLKYTDIYDLASGTVITTIPYCTDSLNTEYIITEAPSGGGIVYGVCDYSGNTILEPQYSKLEIETLAPAGFAPIQEQYRPADGWLYFIGDESKLYRVDTNGENEQCISEFQVLEFQYNEGTVYLIAHHPDGFKLWAISPDGSERQLICEDCCSFYGYNTDPSGNTVYTDFGEWIYYITNEPRQLWKVKKEGTEYIKECIQYGDSVPAGYMRSQPYFARYDDMSYALNFNPSGVLMTFEDLKTGEEITPDFGAPAVMTYRYKNMLLMLKYTKNQIAVYDMDTRSTLKTFYNLNDRGYLYGSSYICHTTFGNAVRINMEDLTCDEIYPCKGIYRCGEFAEIVLLGDRIPHKQDTNGFYVPLTQQSVSEYAVVL